MYIKAGKSMETVEDGVSQLDLCGGDGPSGSGGASGKAPLSLTPNPNPKPRSAPIVCSSDEDSDPDFGMVDPGASGRTEEASGPRWWPAGGDPSLGVRTGLS